MVADAVLRSRAGLASPDRPIGSFLFLGPTGVGKTELARALAEALFGSEDRMVRLDMSEYQERHTVSRLVGAPPGYVGHEEAGQLTETVRRHPYALLLLDEVEKAHPDVFNILLQVLDDGRLTDSHGHTVDFTNTIIVMTSNVGSQMIQEITENGGTYEEMQKAVMESLQARFLPEFLNRVDDVIVFRHLTVEDLKEVVDLELGKVRERLSERGLKMQLTDEAKKLLIRKGSNTDFGARPLRRSIENYVEDPLSEELLKGEFQGKDTILVDVKEIGGKKQLFFTGIVGEAEEATVGAGASPSTPEPGNA